MGLVGETADAYSNDLAMGTLDSNAATYLIKSAKINGSRARVSSDSRLRHKNGMVAAGGNDGARRRLRAVKQTPLPYLYRTYLIFAPFTLSPIPWKRWLPGPDSNQRPTG
jgi:hypothetical protein